MENAMDQTLIDLRDVFKSYETGAGDVPVSGKKLMIGSPPSGRS